MLRRGTGPLCGECNERADVILHFAGSALQAGFNPKADVRRILLRRFLLFIARLRGENCFVVPGCQALQQL